MIKLLLIALAISAVRADFSASWYARSSILNLKQDDIGVGELLATSTESVINFKDFSNAKPPQEVISRGGNLFYVTFNADIVAQSTGEHKFMLICDDGCRAIVDGVSMIDKGWKLQGAKKYYFAMNFATVGERHSLFVESFEHYGRWVIQMYRKGDSDNDYSLLEGAWVDAHKTVAVPDGLTFAGNDYSTLAGGDAVSGTKIAKDNNEQCHGAAGPLKIPEGYKLATDNVHARALATRFPFGASCLFVEGGKAIRTTVGDPNSSDRYCSAATAGTMTVNNDDNTYDITGDDSCRSQVLIARATENPGERGDHATASVVTTSIKSLWFEGSQYAVIHNYAPDASPVDDACNPGAAFALNSGWEIAPDDGTSRAAIMGTANAFGSSCVVLAGGVAIDTVTSAPCPTANTPSMNVTTLPGYVMTSRCPHSVLIRRTADNGGSEADATVTWDSRLDDIELTVPSYALELSSMQFAVMTREKTTARKSKGVCQDKAIRVPTGWSIVDQNLTPVGADLRAAQYGKYGTTCLARRGAVGLVPNDKNGGTCGTTSVDGGAVVTATTVDGGVYAAVVECPSSILISRASPPKDPNAKCGRCIAWGDPHFILADGSRYNFFGTGEYWVSYPTGDAHPTENDIDWYVRHLQEPVKSASKNSVIIISYRGDVIKVRADSGRKPVEPTVTHTVGNTANVVTLSTDGEALEIGDNGMTVKREGSGVIGKRSKRIFFTVTLPNGVIVQIRGGFWNLNLLDLLLTIPERYRDRTVGLCGNCNGDKSDDLRNPDCSTFAKPTGSRKERRQEIARWGEQWKVGAIANTDESAKCGVNALKKDRDTDDDVKPPEEDIDDICENANADVVASANEACASIQNEDARFACRNDICATDDPTAGDTTIETEIQVDEDITGGGDPACPVVKKITQMTEKTFHGFTYALLDNTDPTAAAGGCQETPLRVPDGWRLAPDTAIHRAALSCYSWGADCIVFASGKSYTPSLVPCSDNNAGGELEVSGEDLDCYAPSDCSRRLLIVKEPPRSIIMGNPTVESNGNDNSRARDWLDYDDTSPYSRVDESRYPMGASGAIQISSPVKGGPASSRSGALYRANLSGQDLGRGFRIGAWSRAKGVGNYDAAISPESDYSVYLDIFPAENTDSKPILGKFYAPYSPGTHDWEWSAVDVVLPEGYAVGYINIYCLMRNREGTALFSSFEVSILSDEPFNLLAQGNVDNSDAANTKTAWQTLGNGYSISDENLQGPRTGSLLVDNTATGAESRSSSAYQGVVLHKGLPQATADYPADSRFTALYAGGYAKVVDFDTVKDAYGSSLSLYVDVTNTDGSNEFGLFEPISHDKAMGWQQIDRVMTPKQNVKSFSFNALVRQVPGSALFDGLFAVPTCAAGARVNPSNGFSHGDPHIRSFDATSDGRGWYDVHRIGEFIFFRDPLAEMQVRHSKAGKASVNSAFVVKTNAVTVQIDRAMGKMTPTIRINGKIVSLPAGTTRIFESDAAIGDGTSTRILIRGDIANNRECEISIVSICKSEVLGDLAEYEHEITITAHLASTGFQFLQAFVNPPKEFKSSSMIEGLLGNFDGDPSNDWIVPGKPAPVDDVNVFAKGWEVLPSESLFVHDSSISPESVRDENFVPATVDSFSSEERSSAEEVCTKSGVRGALMKDCLFDTLIGGETFAETGYQRTAAVIDAVTPIDKEESTVDGGNTSGAAGRLLSMFALVSAVCVVFSQ